MPEQDKERAETANAGAALGGGINKAYREKTWDEMGIEQKVERLRRVTQETRSWLHMISEQLRQVPQHQHGSQGEILITQERGYGMVGAQTGAGQRPHDPLA